MQVQGTALTERFEAAVDAFNQKHPDGTCVLFDEVEALEELRSMLGEVHFDQQMWDFTMFHPSPFGHERLAEQAHQRVLQTFPSISSRTTAVSSPQCSAIAATGRANAPQVCTSGPQQTAKDIKIQVKTVKGEVSSVSVDAASKVDDLRAAVLASAPNHVWEDSANGRICCLSFNGQFLQDGPASLTDLGIAEGDFVMVVMR